MKTWRAILASVTVSASCLVTTGCSVTGKSASVDSISRRPFVGIELAPKKRESAPETQRISRDGSIPLEPATANLIANAPAKNPSWWQRMKGTDTPKAAITLPRTDLADAPPEPQQIDASSPMEQIEF